MKVKLPSWLKPYKVAQLRVMKPTSKIKLPRKSAMNPKIEQLTVNLVRLIGGRANDIARKLREGRLQKMSSEESEIKRLWELADFESLVTVSQRPADKQEANILKEAQAALRLLNNPNLNRDISGRRIGATETFKTVTILHSSLPHHPGGYSNRAQGLLQGVSNFGVDLIGYTRPGFYRERVDESATDPLPTDTVDNITYHHLSDSVRRGRGEFQYMESCIPIYKRVFEHEKPEIVHVRSTFLIALPAIIAAKSLGIPVIYEVSGLWELVYEGRGEMGRSNRTERMEDVCATSATRTVTMNGAMASLLKARINRPLEIGLVPNAVDLAKFDTMPPWETQDEQYDLGYIGSLVDYEGLDLLLHAIAELRSRGFEFTAKIVGRGHQLSILQELAASLEISDLVIFTGPVPADEVQQHFSQIHTIVLPRKSTPATECVTPLKPFEAMASKRALITSDVSALNELSQGGTATTVFRSGDYLALAEAILRLADDDEQRQSQIQKAFEMVETFHSWDNIAKIMESELRATARAEYSFSKRF